MKVKHLLEIRFVPSSEIIDKRGKIASALSNEILNQWTISNNQIDFSSKEIKNITAFFSYRNLGLMAITPNNTDFFSTNAKRYIRNAWNFFPTNQIIRVGVRSSYLFEVDNFKKYFESYTSKLSKITPDIIKGFKGDLYDIGLSMNFIDGEDFFHINTGPMESEQIKQIFEGNENLPKVGIYVEVDYFKKEFSPNIMQKHIINFVEKGLKRSKEIADHVNKVVKE